MYAIALLQLNEQGIEFRLRRKFDRHELGGTPRIGESIRLWSPSGLVLRITDVRWHLETGDVELQLEPADASIGLSSSILTAQGWEIVT